MVHEVLERIEKPVYFFDCSKVYNNVLNWVGSLKKRGWENCEYVALITLWSSGRRLWLSKHTFIHPPFKLAAAFDKPERQKMDTCYKSISGSKSLWACMAPPIRIGRSIYQISHRTAGQCELWKCNFVHRHSKAVHITTQIENSGSPRALHPSYEIALKPHVNPFLSSITIWTKKCGRSISHILSVFQAKLHSILLGGGFRTFGPGEDWNHYTLWFLDSYGVVIESQLPTSACWEQLPHSRLICLGWKLLVLSQIQSTKHWTASNNKIKDFTIDSRYETEWCWWNWNV